MWLKYTFTGDTSLASVGAGAGVRHASRSPGDSYEGAFSVPSHAVYDASLTYDW